MPAEDFEAAVAPLKRAIDEHRAQPPHPEANGEHSVAAELRLKTTSRGMDAYIVVAPGRDHEAAEQWARYASIDGGSVLVHIVTDEQVTPSPAERLLRELYDLTLALSNEMSGEWPARNAVLDFLRAHPELKTTN